MTPLVTHHLALGRYGEALAARYLQALGMVVLERNWRCSAGEIDLVLRDGDTTVICEVKTRSSNRCGTPHEAVDDRKVERLHRLAAIWQSNCGLSPRDIRLDLVAIVRPRRGPSTVDHIRGIG
jgi:putative endonuclease